MKITLKIADMAIKAAMAKADELNIPVNIAILDSGGHLKSFARMDNAVLGSIDIAIKKAKSSILFGINSELVWEYCKPGAPAEGLQFTNDILVTFAGGIPFKDKNGEVLGAIGVSGGAVNQDFMIAQAGSSINFH